MIEVRLVVAAYPPRAPRHYPEARTIKLQAKPAVGERIHEGYDSYLVTHVAHQLPDGEVVAYVNKE